MLVGSMSEVGDIVKEYSEKEFDFAIGEKAVSKITGLELGDSSRLIHLLSADSEGQWYYI